MKLKIFNVINIRLVFWILLILIIVLPLVGVSIEISAVAMCIFLLVSLIFSIIYIIPNKKKKTNTKNIDNSRLSTYIHGQSEKFDNIYDSIKDEYLHKLQDIWNKDSVYRVVAIISTLLLVLFLTIFALSVYNSISQRLTVFQVIILFLASLSGFLAMAFALKVNFNYLRLYQNEIYPRFVKLIDENLFYKHDNYAPNNVNLIDFRNHYKMANFDGLPYDYATMNDFVFGLTLNNVNMNVTNSLLTQSVKMFGKNEKNEVFNGVFAVVISKFEFADFKIITNNSYVKISADKVSLDNTTFEKYFDIYTTDKNYIYRLLTSDVMEMLVDFYTKYNIPFEISHTKRYLYLRFPNEKILNKYDRKAINDVGMFQRSYFILNFIEQLSIHLNSNISDIES